MLNVLKGFLAGIGAVVLLFASIVIVMFLHEWGRTRYATGLTAFTVLFRNPFYWLATLATFVLVFIWVARG